MQENRIQNPESPSESAILFPPAVFCIVTLNISLQKHLHFERPFSCKWTLIQLLCKFKCDLSFSTYWRTLDSFLTDSASPNILTPRTDSKVTVCDVPAFYKVAIARPVFKRRSPFPLCASPYILPSNQIRVPHRHVVHHGREHGDPPRSLHKTWSERNPKEDVDRNRSYLLSRVNVEAHLGTNVAVVEGIHVDDLAVVLVEPDHLDGHLHRGSGQIV